MTFSIVVGCALAAVPVVFIAVVFGYAAWLGIRSLVRRRRPPSVLPPEGNDHDHP
jgi:hypothetical protein